MEKRLYLLVFVIGLLSVFVQCDDSTIIGSDLLDNESVKLEFTDTLTIHTSTIEGRPVNSGRLSANTYMIGMLDDPIFGRTSSDVYLGIQVLDTDDPPIFSDRTIDSMVLAIAYDSSGFYGKPDAFYDIEIFKALEPIKEDTTFSNETLPIENDPLVSVQNKFVSPEDTLEIYDPEQDSVILLPPHFRVKINPGLNSPLFTLIQFVQDDESLLNVIPALYIRATPDRSSMAGLSIGSSQRLGDFNKLILFFTKDDGDFDRYEFRFRIDRFSTFTHDYVGSEVESFLNGSADGDSLFFVQGMAGLNGVIDISNVTVYEDFLINKAEIELTVAELPHDNLECHPPIELYAANFISENDELIVIQDLDLGGDFGLGIFGGELTREVEDDGETVLKVRFNVTNHIKNYIDNPSVGDKIIVSSLFDSETPYRTIFYGAGHSKYPAKLNISFTKP